MLKRVVPYILIILVTGGILYLTLMTLDATMNMSESFRNMLITIAARFGSDPSSEWWNSRANIRLLGHVIEYFILGLLVGFVVKRKVVGLFMCMAVSVADQIVKIYVPSRHFDKGDIPFDIIGFCSGLTIAWVIYFTFRKLKESRKEWEQKTLNSHEDL